MVFKFFSKGNKVKKDGEVLRKEILEEIKDADEKKSKKKTGFFGKKKDPNAHVAIDYPIESEIVSGLAYSIRIGASSNGGSVEISFNEGEWQPCRFNSGYWWFDWGYFKPGQYNIVARMIDIEGNIITVSKERQCSVR